MKKARLCDLGLISALESQTIYHAVSKAFKKDSHPTLILMRPKTPYVCIGYHQELSKEVDLEFCRINEIPVFRREIGGGAVLLDKNQLFFHLICSKDEISGDIEKRFRKFTRPAIETYRAFGIEAEFKPINDIQVRGRKIGGIGGKIGKSQIFASSMMFDFNHKMMSQVLKVPSEKMRDKVFQSLEEYITTMNRELGFKPDLREVKERLVENFEKTFHFEFEALNLSDEEREIVKILNERFSSEQFLNRKKFKRKDSKAVKISGGVYVREATYKARGGLIRATLRLRENLIEDLLLSGDFFVYPKNGLRKLEKALVGAELERKEILERIEAFFEEEIEILGVSRKDFLKVLMLTKA
ncbi:MAG: lipoate protein ligase C-terminal domain-containing protein [Candidatus Methanofastidiosia archaeon]